MTLTDENPSCSAEAAHSPTAVAVTSGIAAGNPIPIFISDLPAARGGPLPRPTGADLARSVVPARSDGVLTFRPWSPLPPMGRALAKSRFVHICPAAPHRARRHATALVQAGSQLPATGMFGHLVQTATLPGPCLNGG